MTSSSPTRDASFKNDGDNNPSKTTTNNDGDSNSENPNKNQDVLINHNDVINVIDLDNEEQHNDVINDSEEELLDVETNLESVDNSLHTFLGHYGPVQAVACDYSNAGLIASGSEDDLVYLWQVGSEDLHLKLQGHTDTVASLEFSHDGCLLASGGYDGIVNIWESSTGTLKHKLEGPSGTVEWLQWHPKGHLVLAGSDDFTAWLWNADEGTSMQVFHGHSGPVTCGGFTPDGKLICTGSEDESLRVWNPRSGETVHVVQGRHFHCGIITCVGFTDDSSIAMVGAQDAKASLVKIQTGEVVGSFTEHLDAVTCGSILSPMPFAATGDLDGRLMIWDMHTFAVRNICEHEGEVLQCLWSQESQLVYSGCADGKVRVWDHRTGACERVFHGHTDRIQSLAVAQNGRIVISGSDDCSCRVFEV